MRFLGHPDPLGDLGVAVGKGVAAHENDPLLCAERVEKPLDDATKLRRLDRVLHGLFVGDALVKLLKCDRVAAALDRPLRAVRLDRQVADYFDNIRPQRVRPSRGNGVPCAEICVADALLGILRIGQYIECDRSAQRTVLVVQCPNRQLAALKKQRNYPLVLHRSTLFLAKVI